MLRKSPYQMFFLLFSILSNSLASKEVNNLPTWTTLFCKFYIRLILCHFTPVLRITDLCCYISTHYSCLLSKLSINCLFSTKILQSVLHYLWERFFPFTLSLIVSPPILWVFSLEWLSLSLTDTQFPPSLK